MSSAITQAAEATPGLSARSICDHMIAAVSNANLEREPFCHIYTKGFFPTELYAQLLKSLPAVSLYKPINLRNWSRADGTSTRDEFYLTDENIGRLSTAGIAFWKMVAAACRDDAFKEAVFKKLAPDIAARFKIREAEVPSISCARDVVLFRDTEDYRIKPHPDGLNKIVTLQIYLPEDESLIDLGTSLFTRREGFIGSHVGEMFGKSFYRRHPELFGSRFEETKRFPFLPNSAYAFPVSDGKERQSLHGRDRLTGFSGVRNTMMILFVQKSSTTYVS